MIKRNNFIGMETMFQYKMLSQYFSVISTSSICSELEILFDISNSIVGALERGMVLPRVQNLYPLVFSENLMIFSHRRFLKANNKINLIFNKKTTKYLLRLKMFEISEQLVQKSFKWNFDKQVGIIKLGSSIKFLSISDYMQKIVQNNILIILQCIYEPIFDMLNVSFGFRRRKSCLEAINLICRLDNANLKWSFQGEIKTYFESVHLPKLANILNENIRDKDFVDLIYDLCNIYTTLRKQLHLSGFFDYAVDNAFIFPFLFNIYLHKFDIKLINKLQRIKIISDSRGRIIVPLLPISSKLTTRNIKTIKVSEAIKKVRKFGVFVKERNLRSKDNKFLFLNTKSMCYNYNRLQMSMKYLYNRYANEFLLLTNTNDVFCNKIKKEISYLLKTEFLLELNGNCMDIIVTNLNMKSVKYLGFTIFMKRFLITQKMNTKIFGRLKSKIVVGTDLKSILLRLIDGGYAYSKNLRPKAKKSYAKFNVKTIIEKFDIIILKIYSYYYPFVKDKSEIRRVHYILYYSCIRTLAFKYNFTIAKVFKIFGWEEYKYNYQSFTRKAIICKSIVLETEISVENFTILLSIAHMKQIGLLFVPGKIKQLNTKELLSYKLIMFPFFPIRCYQKDNVRLNVNYVLLPKVQCSKFEDIWNDCSKDYKVSFKILML